MRHSGSKATALLAGVGAILFGCNGILDFDSFSVTAAAPDAGVQEAGRECALNQECIAKLGDFSICRKKDSKCVKLVGPECPRVLGDWQNDDAVILGAINPLFGADAPGGIPLENSIGVAIDDFTQGSNGLPPAGGTNRRRPIAVVSCTETTVDDSADAPERSARHLVDEVGVPAIIGASFSGNTQRVAQTTVPAGVLIMSPTATSVAITDLADHDLVWRTAPSDVIQASAFAALMPQIEEQVRRRLALAVADPLRVWILHKGDSYGKGLTSALQDGLTFNGKPALQNGTSFQVLDYGDPDSNQPPPDYPGTNAKVSAAITAGTAPNVIFLLGTSESVDELLAKIEVMPWPAGKKPTYLFADGGAVPSLWNYVATNDALRQRVFGTIPGTNNANFTTFKLLYESKVKDGSSPEVAGTANAYDALYMIAYSIASLGERPVTGANIADGLKRLVPPGQQVRPGSTSINTTFSALLSGQNVDYTGASGPLDFDLSKGEAPSDIQIWCMPQVAGKAGPATNSGVFYDAVKQSIGDVKLEPPPPAVATACNLQ
jgi:branched-chain amino acid transport system substrate-binding protein